MPSNHPRNRLLAGSLSLVGQTIEKYQILEKHGRLLVGLSGGLDSMIMALLLREYCYRFDQNWEIRMIHIDHGFTNTDIDALEDFAGKLGYPLRIVKTRIARSVARARDKCWRCAWQRRKALLENAEKQNIFNIALGHHQNDVVESVLMNMFFNGDISTLVPKQPVIHGRFYFIRPLYFFRREQLEKIAGIYDIDALARPCPFQKNSKRTMTRGILKQLQRHNPHVISSIFNALQNVKNSYLP